jgi:hypothetical protein
MGLLTYTPRGTNPRLKIARSMRFDIDNGAGTTVDDTIMRHSQPITITAARVVYTDATTGTVAAATIQLGVAVGGATLVAATALENAKAVGVKTALTVLVAAVAADTPIIARHTGIAATAAGQYYLEIEYYVNEVN